MSMDRPVMMVTGASRGIGAATARLAAARGWDVTITYQSLSAEAAAVARDVERSGGRCITVELDVRDEGAIAAAFEQTTATFGRLDVLVNNAGIAAEYGSFLDFDVNAVRDMFDVNVIGAFVCAREAARRMVVSRGGSGGVIVNVSSRAAQLGGAGEWVHYAASKGAIETLTSGLARELASDGVRVCGVRPGLISGDFHRHAPPGRAERLESTIPVARAGTNEEVAEAIVWLASPAASYSHGAMIDVAGGR